jgi:CTP-dependent riboflavin kinase
MDKDQTLIGTIVSGVKQASRFTQLRWFQTQCLEEFGFEPYPGTLNLKIAPEDTGVLEQLEAAKGIEVIPPDAKYCAAKAFAVKVGDLCGAIIMPAAEVRVHGKDVVEIIAGLRLKDALNAQDGDTVVVKVAIPQSEGDSE